MVNSRLAAATVASIAPRSDGDLHGCSNAAMVSRTRRSTATRSSLGVYAQPSFTITSSWEGMTIVYWPWLPSAMKLSAGIPAAMRSRAAAEPPRRVQNPAPYPYGGGNDHSTPEGRRLHRRSRPASGDCYGPLTRVDFQPCRSTY